VICNNFSKAGFPVYSADKWQTGTCRRAQPLWKA